jgi:hypothetical protein
MGRTMAIFIKAILILILIYDDSSVATFRKPKDAKGKIEEAGLHHELINIRLGNGSGRKKPLPEPFFCLLVFAY